MLTTFPVKLHIHCVSVFTLIGSARPENKNTDRRIQHGHLSIPVRAPTGKTQHILWLWLYPSRNVNIKNKSEAKLWNTLLESWGLSGNILRLNMLPSESPRRGRPPRLTHTLFPSPLWARWLETFPSLWNVCGGVEVQQGETRAFVTVGTDAWQTGCSTVDVVTRFLSLWTNQLLPRGACMS